MKISDLVKLMYIYSGNNFQPRKRTFLVQNCREIKIARVDFRKEYSDSAHGLELSGYNGY